METGCISIFLSNFPSYKILNKNNTIIPINKGSVGMERLNAIPGIKSFNWTDRGVKITTTKKILSKEIRLAKTKSKITGKKAI